MRRYAILGALSLLVGSLVQGNRAEAGAHRGGQGRTYTYNGSVGFWNGGMASSGGYAQQAYCAPPQFPSYAVAPAYGSQLVPMYVSQNTYRPAGRRLIPRR
ncbi:MAG: hypothetical protein NVSMB9_12300 [Isosphaeraceae bacterium]